MTVNALDSHIGFWMRAVSNGVSGRFRRTLEARGVSVSEWVALRQAFDTGKTSAPALMEALALTKGAVSKLVTRLEAKGLLVRRADGLDGRAQTLLMTKLGKQLVPALAELADENDAFFFDWLPYSRRIELRQLLREIALHHELREPPVT